MPVLRKRNHWHGLALECLAGLEPASLRYATQRDTSYTIGTISRDCGLSVVTRGEFTQRFRLSQAYAYIIPRFLAPKLAKFQKKKRPLLAANCFPLFFFVIRLEDPLVSLYIADTVFCDRDDRLTIHVDVSIFRRRRKLDSLCQFNQLVYALSSSSLTTRTRPY